MQVTEVESKGLKKIFQVVIEAQDLERQMETELKELGRTVKIPGFRAGNVPMKVLKQRYGKNVQSEVIKGAVTDATRKVLDERKIRAALSPDINVQDYQEGGSLTYTMAVEAMPEMPEIGFKDIRVQREVFDIDEKAIEEGLQNIAKQSPKLAPLEDGVAAKKGQVVTMDFEGRMDGELFEGGTGENAHLELGSGRFIEGFEDQLVGIKAGETRDVKVRFPENYFHEQLSGKDAVFTVKAHKVSDLETPDVDDELAKSKGFSDVRALKEAVRDQMIKEYNTVVRTRLKKRLFDALEAKLDYPLPESMVEMEFNSIWQRLQQAKQEGDPSLEGKSDEELKIEYRKIAERRVRLGLYLAEIGGKHGLQVTREELGRAVMQQASQFPGQEQKVMEFYRKNPERLDTLRGPILEEKAVDWIIERITCDDRKVTLEELAEFEDDAEGASSPKKEKKVSKAKKESADDSPDGEAKAEKKAPKKTAKKSEEE